MLQNHATPPFSENAEDLPPARTHSDGRPGPPPRAESSALPLLSHHHAPCSLSICTRPAQSGMRASGGGGRAWRPRHVWPQRPHTPRAQGHRATPRASGVTPLSQDLKDKWRPQRSRDQCGHTCQARRRGPGVLGCLVRPAPRARGAWGGTRKGAQRAPSFPTARGLVPSQREGLKANEGGPSVKMIRSKSWSQPQAAEKGKRPLSPLAPSPGHPCGRWEGEG